MTRITNSEQVMALVRNQLQRMSKRERAGKTQKTQKTESRGLTQQERVIALGAVRDLSDEDFTQGFVRALLSEEFGDTVSHSPQFQKIVERTTEAMRADPEIAALLKTMRGELSS